MSTYLQHTEAIAAELDRGQKLHPNGHTGTQTASLVRHHSFALTQLTENTAPTELIDTEPKLLTQIAALALRRLTETNLPAWTKTADPTPSDSPSENSATTSNSEDSTPNPA